MAEIDKILELLSRVLGGFKIGISDNPLQYLNYYYIKSQTPV